MTITLWGHHAIVRYHFFDNQLYEYQIGISSGYGLRDSQPEILKSLTEKFGSGKPDPATTKEYLHKQYWETNTDKVYYWLTGDQAGNKYNAGIRVTYLPLQRKIEEIVSNEKNNYL